MATRSGRVIKLSKANKLVKIGHETYDLIRTVKGRGGFGVKSQHSTLTASLFVIE
jgi:hypothetical protein